MQRLKHVPYYFCTIGHEASARRYSISAYLTSSFGKLFNCGKALGRDHLCKKTLVAPLGLGLRALENCPFH